MTIAELKTALAWRAHKDISTANSDDDVEVELAVTTAIRYVSDVEDWECHKGLFTLTSSTTPALAGGTYEYALPTLVVDFRKLQGDSVRYGNNLLEWVSSMEEIDRRIGPAWKDGGSDGTPSMVTFRARNLVLAVPPSADWVTANGSSGVQGYYYVQEKIEDRSGDTADDFLAEELLFPEGFFEEILEVALIMMMQVEDDSNYLSMLQIWNQRGLTRLRGYDEVPLTNEPVRMPQWARRLR